jgi:hypothetical protein
VATDQAEQPSLFPNDVPEFAVDYWLAVKKYFANTHKAPRREELLDQYNRLQPPGSKIELRTFDRRRAAHKQWLGAWPPTRTSVPPWEHEHLPDDFYNVVPGIIQPLDRVELPVLLEGKPAVKVELYDHKTGLLVRQYIDRTIAAVYAGVFLWGMLDVLSDGALDGVIRWCRIIGGHGAGL